MKRHLNQDQRCQIFALKESNSSIRKIARILKISPSTVSREIKRNGGYCGYDPKKAQKKYTKNLLKKGKKRIPISTWKCVIEGLVKKWSPEQIAGDLLKNHNLKISPETIYQCVWRDKKKGGTLHKHLRNKGRKQNKRGSKNAGRGVIPNRVGIEKRPEEAAKKEVFGHLEIDLVIGGNHKRMLITIVDKSTKFLWAKLILSKHSDIVAHEIISLFEKYKGTQLIKTITSDNGKEFARHELITEKTGISYFFANPYHSWERGLNEYTNRLLRQYFPKKMDFGILTQEEVDIVVAQINKRPRKVLNYASPHEIVEQIIV